MEYRLILLCLSALLVSCGPSDDEKNEIATVTCNIIGASRNMDSAIRIREVNYAKQQIGATRFLGTDEAIKEAFQFDLCRELILLDDLGFQSELASAIKLDNEKKLEEDRVLNERIRSDAEMFKIQLQNYIDREQYSINITKLEKFGSTVAITFNCIPGLMGEFDFNLNFISTFPEKKKYSYFNSQDCSSNTATSYLVFVEPNADDKNYSIEEFDKLKSMSTQEFLDSILSFSARITDIYDGQTLEPLALRRMNERIGINVPGFATKNREYGKLDPMQGHSVSPIVLPVTFLPNLGP